MRDKIYSYVHHINEHFNSIYKTIEAIGDIETIDFGNIEGKAILFDFFQIQEMVDKLPSDFVNLLNKDDIKGLRGSRNVIVHGYQQLKRDEIINSIKYQLPALVKEINKFALEGYNRSIFTLLDNEVEVFIEHRVGESFNNQILKANIGYIDDLVMPTGSFQKAVIIDLDQPLPRCQGKVIALLKEDNDDSYVVLVSSFNYEYDEEQIKDLINKNTNFKKYHLFFK